MAMKRVWKVVTCLACACIILAVVLLMLQFNGLLLSHKSRDVVLISCLTILPFVVAFVILCCYEVNKLEDPENNPNPEGRNSTANRVTSTPVRTVTCYLCLDPVAVSKWRDGSHRKTCARGYAAFLSSMPTPLNICCPGCRRKLKLWPDLGKFFICDAGLICPHDQSPKINTGNNRFNCFLCDYDLCWSCAERRAGLPQQQHQVPEEVHQDPDLPEYEFPPSYDEAMGMELLP